ELPVLLKALAEPILKDVHLNIIGDGPERSTLEGLASELGVQAQIIWHGGITNEGEIARIANKCRLFVYPGAVGLSLLHAMAYGLPSIIHDDRWRQGPEVAAFYSAGSGTTFTSGDSV